MEMRGKVSRQIIAAGTKSEHEGVVLETDEGSYILRREEGEPFGDPALDALVGRQILARGFTSGHTLMMSDWDEEGGPAEPAETRPSGGG